VLFVFLDVHHHVTYLDDYILSLFWATRCRIILLN